MSKQKSYDGVYKLKAIEARVVSNKSLGYFNLFKINAWSQLIKGRVKSAGKEINAQTFIRGYMVFEHAVRVC